MLLRSTKENYDLPNNTLPQLDFAGYAKNYEDMLALINTEDYGVIVYSFEIPFDQQREVREFANAQGVFLVKKPTKELTASSLNQLYKLINNKEGDEAYLIQLKFDIEEKLSAKKLSNSLFLWRERHIFIDGKHINAGYLC